MPYEPVGVQRTDDDNDDSELSPIRIRIWSGLPVSSYFTLFAKRLQTNSCMNRSWVTFILRRNPIEDGAISGFSGQKSVAE